MIINLSKMKKAHIVILMLLVLTFKEAAAQQAIDHSSAESDSSSILHAFKNGRIHGHFRYFFMATQNRGSLQDYYANAIGGGIKYETALFHGFQFGVGGFFIYNIGSSNLSVPDPTTGSMNRYELGLFDIENPGNKNDIDRLEELYLKYKIGESTIVFGKQLPDMPFINMQDGRMRPTEVEGAVTTINDIKNTTITAAWLYKISPRSTVEWYSVGESIGVYPQGISPDGKPSSYRGQLESKGVGVLGIKRKISERFTAEVWNQYVDNIFNTSMIQFDVNHPIKSSTKLNAGLQLYRQDAIAHGGNEDPEKTYFKKGSKSFAYSLMTGLKSKKWDGSLNYTRITKSGRYLMPREWGKDPFYTFLPRERNEGTGDLDAVVIKLGYNFPKAHLRSTLGYGHYYLPDVRNAELNKYAIPSYRQLNATVKYDFQKLFEGMDVQFIYVGKILAGEDYGNDKYVINKVALSHFNLIINYNF